jgi:transcription initiation factor IIF auxiliary subunit
MSKTRFRGLGFLAIFAVSTVLIPLKAQDLKIRLDNTAHYIGSGRYEWKVFVVAKDSVLDQIDHVVYTLHPTYPNPVIEIGDRNSNFSLPAKGFGEFTIMAEIFFKNGKRLYLKHWLILKERNMENIEIQTKPPSIYGNLHTENTAKKVDKNKWEWEVFVVADTQTLDAIEYVEYTLHPTFRVPVQKINKQGDEPDRGFFLKAKGWGTFTIGVKVVFNNGEIRQLVHPLTFYPKKRKK